MIKLRYFLIISLFIIFSFNTYYELISNNLFNEKITSNSTLYLSNDKICIIDKIDLLKNTYYTCSIFNEPIMSKFNISNNTVLDITKNYNMSNYSYSIIILIITLYVFKKYNLNIFNSITSDIVVKKYDEKNITNITTIDNFIGCNNIKKDIQELITQIKYHKLFSFNNCNLPKGILLLGPPGCGKTHLVKTIISTTKINYIFISGSDINKIYVGSGSMMLNQLFIKARENKPCLIFIDEADTIIKKRAHQESTSVSTEFNSSLCKLLAELDSINTEAGIVVVFATNMKEEYIDKALLRAGRVDKILHIAEPTFNERKDLFKMYLEKLYNEKIDLNKISKLSTGLTGSDIKKIVNSLRINKVGLFIEKLTTKINKHNKLVNLLEYPFNKLYNKIDDKNNLNLTDITIKITTDDIDKEINKCILGLEREKPINKENKKLIAYHETGHAIMSFLLKDTILPTKICISITSKSLGYTMYQPDEEDIILSSSINNLMRQVFILYSGRCAEKIFMNEITCGAEDDYLKARKILKRLLLNGMLIDNINLISEYSDDKNRVPEYIENILVKINQYIINEIENILIFHKGLIDDIANLIIVNTSITGDDIEHIFKENFCDFYIQQIDIKDKIKEIKNIIS